MFQFSQNSLNFLSISLISLQFYCMTFCPLSISSFLVIIKMFSKVFNTSLQYCIFPLAINIQSSVLHLQLNPHRPFLFIVKISAVFLFNLLILLLSHQISKRGYKLKKLFYFFSRFTSLIKDLSFSTCSFIAFHFSIIIFTICIIIFRLCS